MALCYRANVFLDRFNPPDKIIRLRLNMFLTCRVDSRPQVFTRSDGE
jgi:hypothetical protein